MDQDEFVKTYFGLLGKRLTLEGYDGNELIKYVMAGTMAMLKNNGEKTNEETFWDLFSSFVKTDDKLVKIFENFYETDFDKVELVTKRFDEAIKIIKLLKEKGYTLVLATNPIFPQIATYKRVKWAGLNPEDFTIITTYENSSYSKPNPDYYKSIVEKLGKNPNECLMVGNDVSDDMVVTKIGMKTFLLTNNLINANNEDINKYNHGDYNDLIKFINNGFL